MALKVKLGRSIADKRRSAFIPHQKNHDLKEIIQEICLSWNITNPEQYALQYTDTQTYITQETRFDIQDGAILTLNLSPDKLVEKVMKSLNSPDAEERRSTLKTLAGSTDSQGHSEIAGQAEDPTFANVFIRRNGTDFLVKIVETETQDMEMLSYCLAAFQELMEHGLVPWDGLASNKFIKKVTGYVNRITGSDPRLTQRSLSLLENMVTNGTEMHSTISQEITIENLIQHLQSNNQNIQLAAISLCNSLFMKTHSESRMRATNDLLKARLLREVLMNRVLQSSDIKSEMAHQLYVYQALVLNLHSQRMVTTADPNDQQQKDSLAILYNAAFDSAGNNKTHTMGSKGHDYKRLGFENVANPLEEFNECPPGILPFDLMLYFAKKHQDVYIRVILETFGREEEYGCPFARCTKTLTKMLCELLEIGKTPSDTNENYYPMLFSTDSMLEETYSVCIQLVNKTWKEMRATSRDFSRVMSVVKEQIVRVLNEKPETIEIFKNKVFGLSYQQVLKLMQQEFQERNILDSQSRPVVELREKVLPDIKSLVRQQRLAQLVEGQLFHRVLSRGKQKEKFWYCRLSPNSRFLHYGDAEEQAAPPLEALPNKLPISEVTDIVFGKDSPIVKETKFRKGHLQLAFSLLHGQEEHLDFIAPNAQVCSVWSDGLRSLLNKEMTSEKAKEDFETLLNMEMKLLLLDVEDVPIPETPPTLPDEPSDLNFFYKND
ncbi:engulfment and cell motility protein 2-like isoform X2 [Rhopilema esculentum]|uniref:engulfment and cell motility protein 2-like isoform X2 n=1 Tax=Rhopilema esculentum TaxID=499914 RepID=UPI0031D3D5D6